jgi:hypothetical protein
MSIHLAVISYLLGLLLSTLQWPFLSCPNFLNGKAREQKDMEMLLLPSLFTDPNGNPKCGNCSWITFMGDKFMHDRSSKQQGEAA